MYVRVVQWLVMRMSKGRQWDDDAPNIVVVMSSQICNDFVI